jgi:hypothetical protein
MNLEKSFAQSGMGNYMASLTGLDGNSGNSAGKKTVGAFKAFNQDLNKEVKKQNLFVKS